MSSGISMSCTWQGLEELVSEVSDYAGSTPKKIVMAIQKLGEDTFDVMQGHTPVRTGNLKGHGRLSGSNTSWTISNDCEYAVYVEYGTRRRGARPFFEPAVEYAEKHVSDLEQAIEPG